MRAADLLGRDAGGLRDRFGHHALERTLPEIAGQQADQELPLAVGRPGKQRGELLPPQRDRPGSGHRADRGERLVDLGQRERGRITTVICPGSVGGPEQLADRRVPHADLPLQQLAGQERHGDRDLARLGPRQKRRDLCDFRVPGRGRGDPRRHLDDVAQLHNSDSA